MFTQILDESKLDTSISLIADALSVDLERIGRIPRSEMPPGANAVKITPENGIHSDSLIYHIQPGRLYRTSFTPIGNARVYSHECLPFLS